MYRGVPSLESVEVPDASSVLLFLLFDLALAPLLLTRGECACVCVPAEDIFTPMSLSWTLQVLVCLRFWHSAELF
ncbi:hypothetical protein NPIL_429121 [Nephila pilipes]|uniref:Uncharacterized protein n=1 Tax=Nephila pilipes TaxID=299642 RepID=A0A8X6Q9A4_NEPPI|nr:hypothetical protein NPIL_429121 [Nephila pilipes]